MTYDQIEHIRGAPNGETLVGRVIHLSPILLLLFTATGTSLASRSTLTWETATAPALLYATSALLAYRAGFRGIGKLGILVSCFWAITLIQTISFGSFHPKHLTLYPLTFFVAYAYITYYGHSLPSKISNCTYGLAGVSIIIWAANIAFGDGIKGALSGIYLLEPYAPIVDSYILIYTFLNDGVESILPRNAGFAWEPGAFAMICGIALTLTFIQSKWRPTSIAKPIILAIAILTTQSTTGYAILIMLAAALLFSRKTGPARILAVPTFVFAVLVALEAPFMQDKIIDLWREDLDSLAVKAHQPWNLDSPLAAQRFLSLRIHLQDFVDNPVFGYGGRESEMLIQQESLNIVLVSGLGRILAKFGLIGFLFVAYQASQSIRTLQYGVSTSSLQHLAPAMVLLAVAISYWLLESPLFMTVWLFAFFQASKNNPIKQ